MEYTDSHPEKDDPSTTVHKLVLELLRDKKINLSNDEY